MMRPVRTGTPLPAPAENPRVRIYPSPDGIILLVGVTLDGQWVAEYRCHATDFDDRCVAAMDRRVREKERQGGPRLVR